MSINITVAATGSGSLSVGSVTDTQADVTVGSATTVDLVVNNGVGPAGSGNVTLAAGTGITIATADGTSTISATAVDVSTSNISDLANVNNATPTTGQVLTWTASNEWAPANVASADHSHDTPTFQEITNGTATTTSDLNLDPATGVVVVQGGTLGSGSLTLNCENNSHGVTIKGPPHSSNATYSLTLPDGVGTSGQVLSSDGTGSLQWITPSSGSGSGSGGIGWSSVPTSTSTPGTPGDIAYDATYFYVCTASGWRRTALAGWGQSIIINTQPSSVTTGDATTATFSVNATAPLGSLNYQWQVSTNSGTSWADITGANGSSYSFTAGLSDDGNQYRVVLSATSATSDEISDVVTLTVAETNYITTESGDPLDAENGDNILHDGIGAGTGSGGGSGGGGSSTLATLTDISHVSGGTYTITGGTGDGRLGHEKLEFNNSGTELFAAYDIQFLNIQSYSDTWTPSTWREASVNNWQAYSYLRAAMGQTGNSTGPRCWMPRSISIASEAQVVAGALLESSGDIAWRTFKNTGTAFTSFKSGYEDSELVGRVGNTQGSTYYPQQEQWYNTALSPDGSKLVVNMPFTNTETNTQGTNHGFVRVYSLDHSGTITTFTQVGADIEVDTSTYSNADYHCGALVMKINNAGTVVSFTSGAFGAYRLYRYEYVSGSWTAKANLQVNDPYVDISGDQTRAAVTTTLNSTIKIYDYNATTDAWDEGESITKPSALDKFGAYLGLNNSGNILAVSVGNLQDNLDDTTLENTGAVIVYKKEGTNDFAQYTEPFYGPVNNAGLGQLTISPDGSRVAVYGTNYQGDGSGGLGNQAGQVYILSVPSAASDNPVITTQPTSKVMNWPPATSYATARFSVVASNESGATISYQWQYSENGYSGWTNAPNVFNLDYGTFTEENDGVTPNSNNYNLYLENSGASGNYEAELWEGVAWRCVVTSGGLTTTSTTAYSYVQRLEVTGTNGGTAPFTCNVNTVTNSSASVSYQWFSRLGSGSTDWQAITGATNSYYGVSSLSNPTSFKCLVTNTTNGVQVSQYGPTNTVYANYS